MLQNFADLRTADQVLIVAFILFALYIITCIVIMSRSQIGAAIRRRLTTWTAKLESLRDMIERDDEPYDSEWMDEEKWEESRS